MSFYLPPIVIDPEDLKKVADAAGDRIKSTASDAWDKAAPYVDAALPGIVDDLQRLAADIEGIVDTISSIDLWPPWDAWNTISNAVSTLLNMALNPPAPDPALLDGCAAAVKRVGESYDYASSDVDATIAAAPSTVWEGAAGDAFRASLTSLTKHLDTVPIAMSGARGALQDCSDAMQRARQRHAQADDALRASLHFPRFWPWEIDEAAAYLGGIVGSIVQCGRDLAGSYRDAHAAQVRCYQRVSAALDGITLPSSLTGAMSAVDQVNADFPGSDVSPANDSGPLYPGVVERADAALANMTPAERAEVEKMLAEADPEAKGWILGAVAAGTSVAALKRYAAQLKKMTPAQIKALDISTTPGVYAQPDGTTCGSSSLVAARMRTDPAYAMYIVTGYDPVTGITTPGTPESRFDDAALGMHDQTNKIWPKELGTTPHAAAEQMNRPGGSGVPGTQYEVNVVDPDNPNKTYDQVAAAVNSGTPVPIYSYGGVGADSDGLNGGAHVVLAYATDGDNIVIYDPSRGDFTTLTRQEWAAQSTGNSLGWDNPFAVVVPQK